MTSRSPRFFGLGVLIASVLVSVASAGDYRCNATNCTGKICCDESGNLRTVTFDQGDVVSTEAGWIVNTANGWALTSS